MTAELWEWTAVVLGLLFLAACFLIAVLTGCTQSLQQQIERERALAATRLVEAERRARTASRT